MEQFTTAIRRIVRSGFHNFWRNGFVSLASILVMVITLSVLAGTLFGSEILTSTLREISAKVDVNVYFQTDAEEEEILAIKEKLEQLPETDVVTYTTREEALAAFEERYQNDQTKLAALEELDENPLRASLNITAKNPSQYEGITAFLEGETGVLSDRQTSVIASTNEQQKEVVISRLSNILNTAEQLGIIIMTALIVLSIIITFNTIRLAIYISREEISVMRLVGASKTYIRGPFVVSGMLYGVIAAVVTLALYFPLTYWLAGFTEEFFVGFNIFGYYLSNFGEIFLWVVFAGIAIGGVSSYLAVKRYLRV
ncbi:MAG: permease-like cell division protein FtsX [Candidatus Paceibacterota bacterium]